MLTTTGFFEFTTSRQIRSLARAEPPGLSTRSTMPFTLSSSWTWRSAWTIVSEPTVWPPKKLVVLSPVMIGPTMYTTAILSFLLDFALESPPISISISFIMPAMPDRSAASLVCHSSRSQAISSAPSSFFSSSRPLVLVGHAVDQLRLVGLLGR